MNRRFRTIEEQAQIDEHARLPQTQQRVLHLALNSPVKVGPDQVRAFLDIAPPEMFEVFDALLGPDSPRETWPDNAVVQGFVGYLAVASHRIMND